MIQLVSRCIFHITEKSSLHLWSEIYMESDSSLTKAIVEKGQVYLNLWNTPLLVGFSKYLELYQIFCFCEYPEE